VSSVADLTTTSGFLVADRRGRIVGRVECPMYGTRPDEPDALAVRSGFFSRRRKLVPADTIEQIDGLSGVIGLRVERESIRKFL
jgi:hypothetical protein